MSHFSAVYVVAGQVRRMTFEAADLAEAEGSARRWEVGLEGEIAAPGAAAAEPIPEAYPLPTTQKLLGGVSRATVFRWLAVGLLDRLPETSRVCVTRRSIERLLAKAVSARN